MKFPKESLRELAWEDEAECAEGFLMEKWEDETTGTSRWSVHHCMIFSHRDKFYRSYYSVGATEQQDEQPYQCGPDMIECEEVEKYEKTVIAWRPVV